MKLYETKGAKSGFFVSLSATNNSAVHVFQLPEHILNVHRWKEAQALIQKYHLLGVRTAGVTSTVQGLNPPVATSVVMVTSQNSDSNK